MVAFSFDSDENSDLESRRKLNSEKKKNTQRKFVTLPEFDVQGICELYFH